MNSKSDAHIPRLFSRILPAVYFLLITVILLLSFIGCGGGGGSNDNDNPDNSTPPPNVGGGYTLQVSGGTLNDGSGATGLVILATLRNDQGEGPPTSWFITITGPDIPADFPVLEYTSYGIHSYMSWEWAGFEFLPGTNKYRATAVNLEGSVSIYYDFTITNSSIFTRPLISVSSGTNYTLSWPAVTGAKSYSYEVFDPAETGIITGLTTSTSVILSSLTTTGDYLVRVRAYATNRYALEGSTIAAPTLASQENVSEYAFTFPVNGGDQTAGNYSLNFQVGIMDYGLTGPGPIYGLSIWTSILHTPNTAPDGDWNIEVTDPNGVPINFIYPKGKEHYAYWYYDIEPVSGTYNVLASYGTATLSGFFTIATSDPPPALKPLVVTDIASDITATIVSNDIIISWETVTGAGSYYVNLWAEVPNPDTGLMEYEEVWGAWRGGTTNSLTIPYSGTTLPPNKACDVYVAAHRLDMSDPNPPGTVLRPDMSENYTGYSFTTPP